MAKKTITLSAVETLLNANNLSLEGLAQVATQKANETIKQAEILENEGSQIAKNAQAVYDKELAKIQKDLSTAKTEAANKRATANGLFAEANKTVSAIAALGIPVK